MTANKQNMIAVSTEAKQFIINLCGQYLDQPGKSKSHDLTQREAVDALVAFAEANREGIREETNEEGETVLVTVDLLDLEVKRTLALRAATTRANTAAAKLAEKEKELEALKAQIAALTGAIVWFPKPPVVSKWTLPGALIKTEIEYHYHESLFESQSSIHC